jgi:hypothetical protein
MGTKIQFDFIHRSRSEVNSYGWTMAVHGEFCTGCDAKTGRCGELTKEVKASEQKTVDDLKVELQGLLAVTDAMTPLEAQQLREVLRTGKHWFVTTPIGG